MVFGASGPVSSCIVLHCWVWHFGWLLGDWLHDADFEGTSRWGALRISEVDMNNSIWSRLYMLIWVHSFHSSDHSKQHQKTLISGASRGKAEYQGILWHWICRVWNAVNPLRSSEEIQTHDSHDTWLLYKAISYQSMWLHSSLDSACIMHYHVTNWDAATFQSLVCCHLQG